MSAKDAAPTDEALMAAYATGEDRAFAELYARYQSKLFGFFSRRLPSHHGSLAADLFQKTWLKLHLARSRFDPDQKFSTWIFTIAMNCLRDELGAAYARIEVADSENISDMPDPGDLEERIVRSEDFKRAEVILAKLPGAQREALLFSEWDGLSAREIGEVLKVSEGAVRQLIFRARERLRKELAEGGSE
jgi:RNA polymerase sigma-70 factor (ECF subfamily)